MAIDNAFKRSKQIRDYRRISGSRGSVRPTILIVCEGEKTEPIYFRGFRLTNVNVSVIGTGYNTVSLVVKAIGLKKKAIKDKVKFDRVWCVFDRDSFGAQNFNSALSLAKENSIDVAYSNEAFELWYLLHFSFYDSAMSREQYGVKLTSHLGFKYEKNIDLFDTLYPLRKIAIKNAETLFGRYPNPNPENDNPITRVHILVCELLNWCND